MAGEGSRRTRFHARRRRWSLLIVVGMIGTVLALSGPIPAGGVVHAATTPPDIGLPQCVVDDAGVEGLGCIGDNVAELSVACTGSAGPGNTVVASTSPAKPPCPRYDVVDCYIEVYQASISGCVYLANGDPADVRSCNGRLHLEQPPYSGPPLTRIGPTDCKGRFNTTYIYRG